MRYLTRIMLLVFLAAVRAVGAAPTPDEPSRTAPPTTSAIPFFLDLPADREAFLNRLLRPDFVVVNGEEFQGLREREGGKPTGAVRPPIVLSVAATGRVDGEWTRWKFEFGLAVDQDGPIWAPIRLDGLTLARATEKGKDLLARVGEDRGWQVELTGRGEHHISIETLIPIRADLDSRRIEATIPPAASTRVDLDVPRDVVSASLSPTESLGIERTEDDRGVNSRLSARLSPRAKLDLTWREKADPGVLLPTLLTTQGEIALEVERGFLRTRSSWMVTAIRGMVGQISFRATAADEVLDVSVDDEPVAFGGRSEAGKTVITISLAEPLRPDRPRRVRFSTRRVIPTTGSSKVFFQGFVFEEAKVQTGVLAITRSGPIYPLLTSGRGLRRIDARAELPEGLRTRPDVLMAYDFTSQPFELNLQVEPESTAIHFDARTTIQVESRSAEVNSIFEGRVTQGRPFDFSILVPEGLDLESSGPPDVIEASRISAIVAPPSSRPEGSSTNIRVPRVLTVTLTRAAREAGTFRISLKGRCEIDPSQPVTIPVFRPLEASLAGGVVAVLAGRGFRVEESAEPDGRPSLFRVDSGPAPSGWEWPQGRSPGQGISVLWLRHDSGIQDVPLRITSRSLLMQLETVVSATIDRGGVEVLDEVNGTLAFDTIKGVDITLPPQIPSQWTVDGVEIAGRDLLGRDPDGSRRFRLRFVREQADGFRLRFRYRMPFATAVVPGGNESISLAPIRIQGGVTTGCQVRLSAEPSLMMDIKAPGWTSIAADPLTGSDGSSMPRRQFTVAKEESSPIFVSVHAEPTVALPTWIASRVWIRTLQRPDGDLESMAWYRLESREGAISVELPRGSRWIRARVGDGEVSSSEIESLASDRYRIRFPADAAKGSHLIGLEYVVPAASSRSTGSLTAARLLGDGVVQQTCWEVQVLGTRVGVGVPAGWTDENEWYRDGVIWKRRPWKTSGELADWVAGSQASLTLPHDLDTSAALGRHGYLFSRVGPPSSLPFRIESRLMLVGFCSGPILCLGLLILSRRPPIRPILAIILLLTFLVGTFVELSVVLLVFQSATLGSVLMLAAMAMQSILGRRRGVVGSSGVARAMAASSPVRSIPVSGDDSTAIRRPPAISTVDQPWVESGSVTRKTPIAPSTATMGPQ